MTWFRTWTPFFSETDVCACACVRLSRNGLRLLEKTRMAWIRGASPMWIWHVTLRGPLKNIPQQDCSILWSNMPGWNSSTCSHFLHFPPPPKGHWLSAMRVNKHSYFKSFTWQGQTLCCAVLCCGDFPNRSRAAPVTQELITNVYWDLSQARWSGNCGMMPRDLPFNQCFWCLWGLRARGGLDEVLSDHRDHRYSSALKGPPMSLCSSLVLSLSCYQEVRGPLGCMARGRRLGHEDTEILAFFYLLLASWLPVGE